MDLGLRDKVAIVTGASAGIGLAVTQAFLKEGAKVVGGSRHPEGLAELGSETEVVPVAVDFSTAEAASQIVHRAIEAFGRVDVLVNNVGIAPAREGFIDISDEEWDEVLTTNFMSMVRTSRAVLPHMVERNKGVIINIASESGRQPDTILVDYSVSKAAMLSLSKALADEFGPSGIRVNTVSPGPTRTPLWDMPGGFADVLSEQLGMDKEAAIDHFARNVRELPLGRMGMPEEVAAVVLFLASEQAAFVTGAEYTVNGGSIRAV
ncbi:SDR family NAD(P)-dependent oxidoreductase [Paenibacillus xerothermodurans]|uniref:SDR family NAD(P)-dependent oxidoreductase n=1 Tax=Paenibacillus xerothermodurans TaxID=1977292 RepID=A0A2W1NMQ1_PAEXE|nr:SDR family oxidoreductase [Paenibacillus xerothermodurans]PZE20745.1 SDR family NAD(P)-dependent oxidoreductase [Paenibacillus xerothermodurans]